MLESLPDEPLHIDVTKSLELSDDIDICRPMFGKNPHPTEEVVAIYFGINDEIVIVGLEEDGWEILERFPIDESENQYKSAIETGLDWAVETYGEEDITIIRTPNMSAEAFLRGLPNRPLSVTEIDGLGSLPDAEIRPLFAVDGDDSIVAFIGAFEELVHVFGFSKEQNHWVAIKSEPVDKDDSEITADFVYDWIVDEHGEEVFPVREK